MKLERLFDFIVDVLVTAGLMGATVIILAALLAPRLPEIFATFRAWGGMLLR